ncbi:Exodeoxyribonuclease VII large subunit [Lachnospiraceae bacterium]|nr:Exodeoxyribonuclease VII large subunit [Lachnospiraceae bacterium]
MKYYTVGQINTYIKNIIESDYLLKNLIIKGEVSNCKYHSMGHIYFSLKDENGSMPSVMFKGNVPSGLKFRLEDGQSVFVQGSISVYERDGRYQLYARKIVQDEDTKGKLFAEYEKLKQRLYEEGLFDFEVKKKIPEFPRKVGIVTAQTGAAIQDIMNIAKRRNPYVQLILYPAKVQGEGAAETIARGIRKLDTMGLDTIIVGRGGGSIEDLWAFNEEIVARTIYEAKTPIISGTGHEVDNTIADYVADLRAPTPSAAAELAIPDVMSTIRNVSSLRLQLDRSINNKVQEHKSKLQNLRLRLDAKSPEKMLRDRQQYLVSLTDGLHNSMMNKFNSYQRRFEVSVARLDGLSPTAKLKGGFGYVEAGDKPLTSVKQVKSGDIVNITISDGSLKTIVQ